MTNESPSDLHHELQRHLAQLLNGVVDCSTQHLTEAETDLGQTTVLIDEAVTRLTASFFALHAAVAAQQNLVAKVIAGQFSGRRNASFNAAHNAPPCSVLHEALDTPLTDAAGRIELQMQADAIARHVSAAVTSLQFQDMTSQLLERAVKRIGGLRAMLSDTAAVASALHSKQDGSVVHLQIDAVTVRLARQSETLDDALFKSVRQEHLESGDIDLF